MPYEVDFIGINESGSDSDAIAFRWKNNSEDFVVGIYDGGYRSYGEELGKVLDKYYFSHGEIRYIDFMVCSHPDQDHIEGLKHLLETCAVGTLYVNIPWLYIDDLLKLVQDGRITKDSLERRLKDVYKPLYELEQIARRHKVTIKSAFQGDCICGNVYVLSPSKEFYIEMLAESQKTPSMVVHESNDQTLCGKVKKYLCTLLEDWDVETLREDVETSSENETSIVLLAKWEDDCLFTGDVGIRGLKNSLVFLKRNQYDPANRIKFYQIPHHGGRHNVSPSILNEMVGFKRKKGDMSEKTAYVSAAKDSDHPLKMVTNAFMRRGVRVYSTNGKSLWYHQGIEQRNGYSAAVAMKFSEKVEEWD